MKPTIQQIYTLLIALIRLPNMPKKIKGNPEKEREWATTAKLSVKKTDPLYAINNATLYSENYTLSNRGKQVSGYRKIGSFKVRIRRAPHNNNIPRWSDVLLSCPDKYHKEGIGLLLLERNAVKVDPPLIVQGKNTEFEVQVYYKAPLFTKAGMRALSNTLLTEMFTKGEDHWNESHHRRNAWLFIEREYYRRFDHYSTHYLKYLDSITLHSIFHKIKDGRITVTNKEECLEAVKNLKKEMDDNYPKYWKYQYLDEQIPQ